MRDDLFLRGQKVPMTKEAVRALALERLELPCYGHLIDVGAGTGSVALEAAMRFPDLQVTAIERNPAALALISENRQRLGCHNVAIIAGVAPLANTAAADAIFIGGSGGHLTDLIDWALMTLKPDGRLVLTFILLNNLNDALAHLQRCAVSQLDCVQLQLSTLTPLGSGHYFKPNNPTYLISCHKEARNV
ncbi:MULTISPECIES: decarboxylating cobalt-precorrin-6B (C(15))-methyltransferase [Yersinia]|jgi:cobalt-precorrin-6B (C15)-methyltransferase|uniref:Cobalt-precorrin-6Y C(15)-methyltransferase n=1 Tax=Yersinia intermedia TaxID=631 RepID=A0A0T9LX73_YERIN|nr:MULTISPECIES: decarboxylating cobalt-precorrin-6B (C(15))-methyltransferase [Yersinia]AJJ20225.1 precorrin-6Y C5,15-methyltransferase (decarboxylating), CbiT subunit [Yersinia intermedia]ARB85591.1 decarboxylating cobalt-precorrin-6B (C(15))-methyltransferase [Yersinia sp. FDAARGOS_228]AVL35422.1 decarboxylating cobalt-precorrin-6B (C(15))-methyltransferase [Yersinia intermedia]MCB5297113.1 decarboxylating cobalt-precorrin-6B (C(15))-methyltransferase [Yersinia intermedia]MCW8110812.1 decar